MTDSTARINAESLRVAMAVGFVRALRFSAHVARTSGQREVAIKLSDLARSDLTYKLANMEEVDAQVVFAAAVADCSTPTPIRRKPVLTLISNEA